MNTAAKYHDFLLLNLLIELLATQFILVVAEMMTNEASRDRQSSQGEDGIYDDPPVHHDESPEFLSESIEALNVALQRIEMKPAYEQALVQSKSFLADRAFALMFLRAESFDEERAAKRLAAYMEKKRECFGPSQLGRNLNFGDMDKASQKMLKQGNFQVLPSRDTRNRAVLFDSTPASVWLSSSSNFRALVCNLFVLRRRILI